MKKKKKSYVNINVFNVCSILFAATVIASNGIMEPCSAFAWHFVSMLISISVIVPRPIWTCWAPCHPPVDRLDSSGDPWASTHMHLNPSVHLCVCVCVLRCWLQLFHTFQCVPLRCIASSALSYGNAIVAKSRRLSMLTFPAARFPFPFQAVQVSSAICSYLFCLNCILQLRAQNCPAEYTFSCSWWSFSSLTVKCDL